MALPPLPTLPPPLPILKNHDPRAAIPNVRIEHMGKDKLRLVIDATLTRTDAFRLIGELERMAAFL